MVKLIGLLGYQNGPALQRLAVVCTKLRRELALGSGYLDAMLPYPVG